VAILALDLLKKPDILTIKPIYVVMGEDAFLRAESIVAIEKLTFAEDSERMGLTKKSGDSAILADVLDELATQSFFSPKRMIALDPADAFITKHRAELEKYAQRPCQGSVLVLAAKLFPASTKLYKFVDSVGLLIDARPPNVNEMVSWVMGRASLHQTKIDRDAAVLMTELVGPEAGLLDQELEKLAIATHDGKKSVIKRDDVARYVHAGQADTVWNMIERATTGNSAQALADLDALISSGENPVGLLAATSVTLRKLHHAGILRQRKVEANEAFREAGFPGFPKAIDVGIAQHRHLGPKRVNDLPGVLIQADLDLKGWSDLSPRSVMERLIVKLAQPRKD
jgi:DNA polymerase-3 subunit delta